jgi:hypothetical protein
MRNERRTSGSGRGDEKLAAAMRHSARLLLYAPAYLRSAWNAAAFCSERIDHPVVPAQAGFAQAIPGASAARALVVAVPERCPCCGSAKLSKLGEDITETLEVIPRSGR